VAAATSAAAAAAPLRLESASRRAGGDGCGLPRTQPSPSPRDAAMRCPGEGEPGAPRHRRRRRCRPAAPAPPGPAAPPAVMGEDPPAPCPTALRRRPARPVSAARAYSAAENSPPRSAPRGGACAPSRRRRHCVSRQPRSVETGPDRPVPRPLSARPSPRPAAARQAPPREALRGREVARECAVQPPPPPRSRRCRHHHHPAEGPLRGHPPHWRRRRGVSCFRGGRGGAHRCAYGRNAAAHRSAPTAGSSKK